MFSINSTDYHRRLARASSVREVTTIASAVHSGNKKCDLLSFLACAQEHHIDIVPILWENDREVLGGGGQGTIMQGEMSLQGTFAFKRRCFVDPEKPKPGEISHLLHEMASEISVLGHPAIRDHDNIARVEGICWDVPYLIEHDFVWPVLFFKKAPFGDLQSFMRADGGMLSTAKKMKLCADVASALVTMHENGVIHSDIKPANVLIFGQSPHDVTAKLSDFGYSTMVATDGRINRIGRTELWDAPESLRQNGEYSLMEARRMDIYSFGLLCLWVLFREALIEFGPGGENPSAQGVSFHSMGSESTSISPDLRGLGRLRTEPDLIPHIKVFLTSIPEQSFRDRLEQVFSQLLCKEVDRRVSELTGIIKLLDGDERNLIRHVAIIPPGTDRAGKGFQILRELEYLCLSHSTIWKTIIRNLQEQAQDKSLPADITMNAALQLALCKRIGLGKPLTESEFQEYLQQAGVDIDALEKILKDMRTPSVLCNSALQDLYDTGIIQPDYHNHTMEVINRQGAQAAESATEIARREDIRRMEQALGKTHPGCMNLKETLRVIVMKRGDRRSVLNLLSQNIADLKAGNGDDEFSLVKARGSHAFAGLNPQNDLEFRKAQAVLEEVYEDLLRLKGPRHSLVCSLAFTLGDINRQQGYFSKEHQFLSSAADGIRHLFGELHPVLLSLTHAELISAARQGQMGHFKKVFRESKARIVKNVGFADGRAFAFLFPNLGILFKQRHPEAAEEESVELLKALKGYLPYDHPAIINTELLYADVLMFQGKFRAASREFRRHVASVQQHKWPPRDLERFPDNFPPHIPFKPVDLPRNPVLMILQAKYSLCMQGVAQEMPRVGDPLGNGELDRALEVRRDLFLDLEAFFAQRDPPGPENRSIIISWIRKGYRPIVELVLMAGSGLALDGQLAQTSLAIANDLQLRSISVLLSEHQRICYGVRGQLSGLADLRNLLSGEWEGTIIQSRDGPSPPGSPSRIFTANLVAYNDEQSVHGVRIQGSITREVTLHISGVADLAGSCDLSLAPDISNPDGGWLFQGYWRTDPLSIGGGWTMHWTELPAGTFLMFKTGV